MVSKLPSGYFWQNHYKLSVNLIGQRYVHDIKNYDICNFILFFVWGGVVEATGANLLQEIQI